MPKDEEWIRAAMADDMVVVELLMRLRQQCHAAPSTRSPAVLPPPDWGIRQPRSKAVLRCVTIPAKKVRLEATTGSPTTPLSWSGGAASPSPTADGGFEESSRTEIRSATLRSKVAGTNEASNTTAGKRSRKKKTFAELKVEESSLLKESIYLKKKVAELRVTVKEHRATNEKLKRMKLAIDVQTQGRPKSADPECFEAGSPIQLDNNSAIGSGDGFEELPQSDSCKVKEPTIKAPNSFSLPDLNITPSEEDVM